MTTAIEVNIQPSEGVNALNMPQERLEAIAQEIAETGLTDPHWAQQSSYTLTLAYQWGETPLTLVVKRHGSRFEVVFALTSEVKDLGFHAGAQE